jgi:hypothetical protein
MLSKPDSTVEVLGSRDEVDVAKLFLYYVLFGGDCKRVALVSRVDLSRIESLAHDFSWKSKLAGRRGLDTEEGQEAERALNRVANFVAAERLSRVFGRLIDELDSDPSFAKAFCTSTDEETGVRIFNTKNLVELAKGLEIVQNIGYRALQDKHSQAADLVGNAKDPTALAMSTYKALVSRFDRNVMVDTTTEIVKAMTDDKTGTPTVAKAE